MSVMRDSSAPPGQRAKDRQKTTDQAKQQPRQTQQAVDGPKQNNCRNRKSPKGRRLQQPDQKLQQHMEREDRRVKQITEAILYDFLPAAFNVILPQCEDPRTELSPERCRTVAAATLTMACLMNAPPLFLDFLIRVPWRKLRDPGTKVETGDWLNEQLDVPDDESRRLVNTRIDPMLINTMLEFLYQDDYQDSVPPMLRLTAGVDQKGQEIQQAKPGGVTLDSVAALLDGATPLHCAAIRGNPAQVDHLLYCGANTTIRTMAGDLPIELVPVCWEKSPNSGRTCRCMRGKEQEVWECRSSLARTLIMQRCFITVGVGLWAWVKLVFLVLLNWFGLWGCSTCLCTRPVTQKHVVYRRDNKRKEARRRAQKLLDRMRQEAQQGHAHLDQARLQRNVGGGEPRGPANGQANKLSVKDPSNLEDSLAEKAFRCFVRAVHALQSLELQGDTVPQGFMDASAPPLETSDCQVLEDEQADLYCCWAESVLLKFRGCNCCGCAALAVQAIRMAHIQVARLFARIENRQEQQPSRWKDVGQALMRVVHVHICLLLDTEAKQSATRASVWRAEQCLKEWERLRDRGLDEDMGLLDACQVQMLDRWAGTAESDLMLVEALHGSPLLPSQTMREVLETAILYSPSELPYLARTVSEGTVKNMESALDESHNASGYLSELAMEVTNNARRELCAGDNLRDVVSSKGNHSFPGAVDKLSEAIAEAEQFPHLVGEVANARVLQEQWRRRAQAMERLDIVMNQVKAQPGYQSKTRKQDKPDRTEMQGMDMSTLESKVKLLEVAIEEAKESSISVDKAKRLLKELQGQAAAADAAANLDGVMAKKPCGSGVLKAALLKAEAACSGASGSSLTGGVWSPSEFLVPRVSAARKRMEVEKAVEALGRATSSCKMVSDLPKLEASILSARKVGAQELDPEGYASASELRVRLHNAAIVRQALEAAVRNLQKQQRQEDAEDVEHLLTEAEECNELLAEETGKARGTLEQWKSQAESGAKLSQALQEGMSAEHLSQAIHEAAAAGVKVHAAKRILKLMQRLETALLQAAETPSQYGELQEVVRAAEQGGVNAGIISKAQDQLKGLLAMGAREALEGALEQHASLGVIERRSVLKAALDKAREVTELEPKDATHLKLPAGGPSANDDNMGLRGTGSSKLEHTQAENVAQIRRLAQQVIDFLREDEVEFERLQAEKHEKERVEQEQRKLEQLDREKREVERLEKERQEKEERERLEAEKKEKEKVEKDRKKREEVELVMALVHQERPDKQRKERVRADRLRRLAAPRCLRPNTVGPHVHAMGFEGSGNFVHGECGMAGGLYDCDESLGQGDSLNALDSEVRKLIDSLNIDDPAMGAAYCDLQDTTPVELGLVDVAPPLYRGGSSLPGPIADTTGREMSIGGLDFGAEATRPPVDWSMDAASAGPVAASSDFSIGATRGHSMDFDAAGDPWALKGLRDIQTGHNAPYYPMHVDLVKSLMQGGGGAASQWGAQPPPPSVPPRPLSTSDTDVSKSLEQLGIIKAEFGRRGGQDFVASGGLGTSDLSTPAPDVPPFGNLWRPSTASQLTTPGDVSRHARGPVQTPGPIPNEQDPGLVQYYQSLPFGESGRFGGIADPPPPASATAIGPQPPGMAGFAFGAPGVAAFSHGPPMGPPFVGASSPLPSSPPRGLGGLLGAMSPTGVGGHDFGPGGFASPTNFQSPFPGVGVGIPGSASGLLGAGMRSLSLQRQSSGRAGAGGEVEPAVLAEELAALSVLARRDSSKSQP